jgi:hypothetical protein
MRMTRTTDDEALERVRRACLEVAQRAYEDAGLRGLCAEGRWEAAIEALRTLDVRADADRRDGHPDDPMPR